MKEDVHQCNELTFRKEEKREEEENQKRRWKVGWVDIFFFLSFLQP